MENEIKVNEYVRTDTGRIDEVVNPNYYMPQYIECEKGLIWRADIVKHSENIIDILECGDYVNGEKVTQIFDLFDNNEKVVGKRLTTEYRTSQYTGLDGRYYIYNDEIKKVVTKEQMKAIEYRVKE